MSGYWEAMEREAQALPGDAQPSPRSLFEADQAELETGFLESIEELEPRRDAGDRPSPGPDKEAVKPLGASSEAVLPLLSQTERAEAVPATQETRSIAQANSKPEAAERQVLAPAAALPPVHAEEPVAETPPQAARESFGEAPPTPPAATPVAPTAIPPLPVEPIPAVLSAPPEPAPPPPSPVLAAPVPAEPIAPPVAAVDPAADAYDAAVETAPRFTIEIGEIHIRLAPEQPAILPGSLRPARGGAGPSLDAFLARERRA